MSRLQCRSVNHDRPCHRIDNSRSAIITRCMRCRKPTCSECEGGDNGFRDICDDCWALLDARIRVAKDDGLYGLARRYIRRWAARGRFREVLREYEIE